jgi:hypothetical protein
MIQSFSVGTTAAEVLPAPSGSPYKFVAISNVGQETAYIKVVPGGDAVTSLNGIPLAPGAAFVLDQDSQKELFDGGASAITASGTTTISVQAF